MLYYMKLHRCCTDITISDGSCQSRDAEISKCTRCVGPGGAKEHGSLVIHKTTLWSNPEKGGLRTCDQVSSAAVVSCWHCWCIIRSCKLKFRHTVEMASKLLFSIVCSFVVSSSSPSSSYGADSIKSAQRWDLLIGPMRIPRTIFTLHKGNSENYIALELNSNWGNYDQHSKIPKTGLYVP